MIEPTRSVLFKPLSSEVIDKITVRLNLIDIVLTKSICELGKVYELSNLKILNEVLGLGLDLL